MNYIIIPVKNLNKSKLRLVSILNDEERCSLCLAMLNDILGTVLNSKIFEKTVIVSSDKLILDFSKKKGALTFYDGNKSLNSALEFAMQKTVDAKSILILPLDVPLIKLKDLEIIIEQGGNSKAVIIVPSLDGKGTNALFMRPPNIISSKFGLNSFEMHFQEAKNSNIFVKVLKLPTIALDIDTVKDLELFMKFGNGYETKKFLNRIKIFTRF